MKKKQVSSQTSHIGTLKEKTLHSQLKDHYSQGKHPTEIKVEGYFIDVKKPRELVEIQTKNLMRMKNKLRKLLKDHKVRLVHPISSRKTIINYGEKKNELSRRKSPKSAQLFDLGNELMHIHGILCDPNLCFEVIVIEEEEERIHDGKGSWRRKGASIYDRRLTNIQRKVVFRKPVDYLKLIPGRLPDKFTNAEVAKKKNIPAWKVRMVTYVWKKIGIVEVIGKKGNSQIFRVV